jgi:chemotaxis protein histidine kinase CheA
MVPLTLASVEALIVEISPSGPTVAIPIESVRQISYVSAREVTRSGEREAVFFEDGIVQFSPLHRVLAMKSDEPAPRSWSVLIVQGNHELAAFGVHRVVGISRASRSRHR